MNSDSDTHFSEDSEETDINEEELFNTRLQRIRENNPETTSLNENAEGEDNFIHNLSNEVWEQLGRDIANNIYFKSLVLYSGALNDQKMKFLFRGLTRSNIIRDMQLFENGFSVAGVRSMVPFLQNATNLNYLDLDDNNIQSEGFNILFSALRNKPIETLRCSRCFLESIEIDIDCFPKRLTTLHLDGNNINADGCRELVKLLERGESSLTALHLDNNNIDDDGVEILVDALRNNTSLEVLYLMENDGISVEGMKACLRLLNDISCINATLQSNHTLIDIYIDVTDHDQGEVVQTHIGTATSINERNQYNPEAAGKEKVIQTQLHSGKRAKLADLQGVTRSLYSDINPLHLPEVLALVGLHHGQRELYVALKSSIAGVISTVNRKGCIQQRRAYLVAELEELDAELEAINESERDAVGIESDESRSSSKRRRK